MTALSESSRVWRGGQDHVLDLYEWAKEAVDVARDLLDDGKTCRVIVRVEAMTRRDALEWFDAPPDGVPSVSPEDGGE